MFYICEQPCFLSSLQLGIIEQMEIEFVTVCLSVYLVMDRPPWPEKCVSTYYYVITKSCEVERLKFCSSKTAQEFWRR